jgi:hypothetical protein
MIALASSSVSNQCKFRHSRWDDPLNVSTSIGLPGRIKQLPRKFTAVIDKKILGGLRRAANPFNAATTCSLRKRSWSGFPKADHLPSLGTNLDLVAS